ncbi:MAG: hypothetical protein HRF40_03740 [Nitrososphaera sp.]
MTDSVDITAPKRMKTQQEVDDEFWGQSKSTPVAELQQEDQQIRYDEETLMSEQSTNAKQLPVTVPGESESSGETADGGNLAKVDQQQMYRYRSYIEISAEYRDLHAAVTRANELIPQMYNRLTLVDGYDHPGAMQKMYEDHRDLRGFSLRNIRRYLPTDNPIVPRRVRTSRPKQDCPHSDQTSNIFTEETQTELKVRNQQEPYILPLIIEVDAVARSLVTVRVDQAKFDEWNYSEGSQD